MCFDKRTIFVSSVFFGTLFTILTICASGEPSWSSQNIDIFDFLHSSATLNVAHPPGLPLYVIAGWLAMQLPGNDVGNMTILLSVVPTIITSMLIFYIVRVKTMHIIAPFLAAGAFVGSQVVFSQAIMPEIYALQGMLVVLAYVLIEHNKLKLFLIAMGLAACISWGALILMPLFAWRYWDKFKTLRFSVCLFFIPLLLYLYIPIANRPPHLSLGPTGLATLLEYYLYHPSLVFALPVWELPQRLGEGIAILLGSLGVCGVLAILILRRQSYRTLLVLCIPGTLFYLTASGADAFVQLGIPTAFACIAVGYGLSSWSRKWVLLAACVCVILIGLNTHHYNLGKTLDPTPTGASQMLAQLDQVPNNSWVIALHRPSYAGIYYYNYVTGRNLKGIVELFAIPTSGKDPWPAWKRSMAEPLDLPNIPYQTSADSHEIAAWSVAALQIVAAANPSEEIWAVLLAGDVERVNVTVVRVSTDMEVIELNSSVTTQWWEYVTIYPYVYKYVSGGYMMSMDWRTGTATNMTVGLMGVIMAFGAVIGYTLPQTRRFKRLTPKSRTFVTMLITASATMVFCYLLSIFGVAGFRW